MVQDSRLFLWRGWISAVVFLPIVSMAAFSRPRIAEGTWPDGIMDLVGWIILAGGIFVQLWATLYVGGRKSQTLVTSGPYALCRRPLYVASFLIIVALGVFMLSLSVVAAALVLACIYAIFVVPSEERHALACCGESYRAYAACTPRMAGRPAEAAAAIGRASGGRARPSFPDSSMVEHPAVTNK
jgi:protein-S-isoprenylcysteine O-methyltransferase Ste14